VRYIIVTTITFVTISADFIFTLILENSFCPIFINEKEKLVGQYITNEKVDPCLASIDKCVTL